MELTSLLQLYSRIDKRAVKLGVTFRYWAEVIVASWLMNCVLNELPKRQLAQIKANQYNYVQVQFFKQWHSF